MKRALVILVAVSMLVVPATAIAGDGHDTIEAGDAQIHNDENNEWRISVPAEAGGEWNEPVDGEIPAVNLALMPGGQLLYYSGVEANENLDEAHHVHFVWEAHPKKSESRVVDLDGDGFDSPRVPAGIDQTVTDLFCSGTTITPQGDVVVPGATDWYTMDDGLEDDAEGWEGAYTPLRGANQTMIFEPNGDDWRHGPDMDVPRWYPSALQLPDGDTLVTSGVSTLFWPNNYNTMLERYDPTASEEEEAWEPIEPRIQVADGVDVPQHVVPETEDTGFGVVDDTHRGIPNLPMYPRLHTIPGGPHAGEVLYTSNGDDWAPFGWHPNEELWSFFQTLELDDEADAGTWEIQERSKVGHRNLGATVPLMVDASEPEPRYLSLGGTVHQSGIAQTTSEIVDASGETITSELTSDRMEFPRWSVNSVLLPDGSVFTVGGSMHDTVLFYSSPTTSPQNAERFVPNEDNTDGEWELLPPMENPRAYHSSAVLLPDASVAVGGHVPLPALHDAQRSTTSPQPVDSTFEIYEPAYLDHEAGVERPVIDLPAGSSSVAGQPALEITEETAQVNVANIDGEAELDSLTLVRPGAATHQYNADQLGVELEVIDVVEDESGSKATVTFDNPLKGEETLEIPPGYYMLFANKDAEDGLYPSEAAWVQLGS